MDLVCKNYLEIIENKYENYYFNNSLECVVLFVNYKELHRYYDIIKSFKNSIELENINIYFLKKLDIKIILEKNIENLSYSFFEDYFNSVEIIKSNKSDPNLIFFEAFEYLFQYNTTLFLGRNCNLQGNWVEKIYNFTRFSGPFWISCNFYEKFDCSISNNAALYATSNYLFLLFIKFCYKNYINNNYNVDKLLNEHVKKNKNLFKLIKSQFVQNNIFDYYEDIDINELKVLDKEFDYIYYYIEYPEVLEYYSDYCEQNNISDEVRAYHHYLIFGKKSGYKKNKNNNNNENNNFGLRNFSLED